MSDENANLAYKGAFLVLYIVGLIVGLCLLVVGVVGIYLFLNHMTLDDLTIGSRPVDLAAYGRHSRASQTADDSVSLPLAVYIIPAVLFISAAIVRRVTGRWLLFFGALLIILMNAFSIALMIASNPDVPTGHRHAEPPSYISFPQILFLIYPVLCIVIFIASSMKARAVIKPAQSE